MELEKLSKENLSLRAELEDAREDAASAKRAALTDSASYEDQLDEMRGKVRNAEEEAEAIKVKRDELVHRVTRLSGKLTRLEEGEADDADGLEEATSNRAIQKVRKAELLELRALLEAKQVELDELGATVELKDGEIRDLKEQLGARTRELAGERRVVGTLTEERDSLAAKIKALEREGAANASDVEKLNQMLLAKQGEIDKANEQWKGAQLKGAEAALKLEQLSKDAEKLRSRLSAKEELVKTSSADCQTLQQKLEEAIAEAGRKERALTVSRGAALEERQKSLEHEQSASGLAVDKKRLEQLLEKRTKENQLLSQRATEAEAIVKMLQGKLDQIGAKDAEASLELRPLKDIQKVAGVFDPLAQLPNVPVLADLFDTIQQEQTAIKEIAGPGGNLAQMAQVEVLHLDQTLPPDEGQLFSRQAVPLPYPPVLMRQFAPPPTHDESGTPLRPPSPPPPDEAARGGGDAGQSAFAGGANSGAGTLVLPEQGGGSGGGSRALPDQS